MSFMQPQITGRLRRLELHGDHGITYIPACDVPETLPTVEDCEDRAELARFDQYYLGSHVEILRVRTGYGVRESAPGYLDCTAWEVLDTRASAEALYKALLDASDED